jgi:hypothetical protein
MNGVHLSGVASFRGKEITPQVDDTTFLNKAEEIVKFSETLVNVARMVDGDKPTMTYFMSPWIKLRR